MYCIGRGAVYGEEQVAKEVDDVEQYEAAWIETDGIALINFSDSSIPLSTQYTDCDKVSINTHNGAAHNNHKTASFGYEYGRTLTAPEAGDWLKALLCTANPHKADQFPCIEETHGALQGVIWLWKCVERIQAGPLAQAATDQ